MSRSPRLEAASSYRYLAILALAAVGVRIGSAWFAPGFYSGDDVEIHEMTLSALCRTSWPIWDLRSPIFPFLIIYPAQYLAYHVGWTDTTQPCLCRACRGRSPIVRHYLALISAGEKIPSHVSRVRARRRFLIATNKLQMAFGSSELPQTCRDDSGCPRVSDTRPSHSGCRRGACRRTAGGRRLLQIQRSRLSTYPLAVQTLPSDMNIAGQ